MSTLQQTVNARRAGQPEPAHLCYATKPQCASLVLECSGGERWVLPWVHFVFGRHGVDGGGERLTLTFASHEVIVQGQNLAPLADEAAGLRLEVLRELPTAYRAASGPEPFVEKIIVRLPAEPAARDGRG